MRQVDLVCVMPIGPEAHVRHVADTVESILHFTGQSRRIILLDDSGCGTAKSLGFDYSDIDVITSESPGGYRGALAYTLGLGYLYALDNYDFKVLLRLDSDALLIGPEPEKDAIAYFECNQHIGLIGSCKYDCNNARRSFASAEMNMRNETSWHRLRAFGGRYMLRHPNVVKSWRRYRLMVRRCLRHGDELGEHCLGAAYFVSSDCLRSLRRAGLLTVQGLRWSGAAEDHLIGLFAKSVGFQLGDFATGDYPMGLRWQGLPCAPQDLVNRGKKIIHSTRFWQDMDEDDIRAFFAQHRNSSDRGTGTDDL